MNNYRQISAAGFLALSLASASFCAYSQDTFVGKYSSLSKQNNGLGEHGKYTINISKTATGYLLECFNEGQPLFKRELQQCTESDLKAEYFHSYALPGRREVLCDPKMHSVQFFYSEKGIKLPDRMAPDELIRKSEYYGNVQWSFFGFKKIEQ
jgi:hypothetical protein